MAEPQTPDEGAVQPDQPLEPEAQPESTPDTTPVETKTFDEDYVKELRQENAKYRKRAQEAETKIQEHEQAQMSELEKMQTQAETSNKEVEGLRNLLNAERTRNAVTLEATRMDFIDAGDALSLIDVDELTYDEETGKPSTRSVQGALTRLVKDKPYLVAATPTPGSADGGARGETGDLTQEEKVAQYGKELQERYGSVPTPKV